jgi:glycosyltransferase involved in cell wall biosynthesis
MILKEPYSGVEVTVHQLAAALAEFGSVPLRFCLPEGHRPLPDAAHAEVCTMPFAGRSRLLRILWEQLVLPAKLASGGAGLLHAPAYVAPLATRCPVVLTVHDLHALTHPQFCTRANRMHYGMMLPPSIRRAAAIIVFSAYTERIVHTHFECSRTKTVVIPPGISAHFRRVDCAAEHRRVRQAYSLPPEFLLFVGDLTRRKNIEGLISAFAVVQTQRPDLHLVLAGACDRSAEAALEREMRRHGVGRRVTRAGYVLDPDLPVLYSMAQAFVFPSHDEGFGLPPLEAMACGCPAVCSGGAPPEICADAAAHCDPLDRASIAAAVGQLLDDARFRREKIAAGYKRAAEFSWKTAALKTEEVYRQLLSR